ncbi:MAG: hypothetical protein DME12_06000 [Candidatus Rokuibacteriota bacterium]|nr:MAG: hypothetical protein DME12_06000 [Candidatus Rokubacteria bacterium]PYN66049.1 MAG: hypothetical protein DMD93_18865 [Candidatus Rokubacteria bacterium]
MRWQTTAVLAVVLLALGTFYYVYEIRGGPERAKIEAQKGRLWTVDAADVDEMELKRGAEAVTLKRESDGWRLLVPVTARGDRSRVDETLTTLTTARVDREIESAPTRLDQYGLDKPAAAVTLQLKDGRRLELQLGAKSPTGVWVYAREAGKAAVFVVSDTVLRDVTRPLSEFRDKTVLAFGARQVTAFEVVTREGTLAVEQVDGRWRLTRPVALAADTETVTAFLDKLQSTRIKEFVAESPKSLVPYGLERPIRVSIHTGRDKDRVTASLLIGTVDKAKGVYAMRPGESSVLLLPAETWELVPKNVAVLRNKVVVEIDRDKVTRVDLESPKGKVGLTQEQNRWRIVAPENLPADQVEAGALLFKLRDLKAQGFLTDDASGIARYLARPTVRVTIGATGAAAPTTVLLAPAPDRRGGKAMAYAAVSGRGPVVLVGADALDGLTRSVTELRDRTVLPALEPRDVRTVRVRAGGQTLVVERSGEADWRIIEGGTGPAKGSNVENLLYVLRGLKWKAIAAPGGQDPMRYGLDAPTFEATLLRAGGAEIATVLVGRREGDHAYVKLKVRPAIYDVDAKALGELPKIPDDFKG